MYAFEYVRANSVRGAASALAKHEDSKILAGGHTLIPTMKQRLANPPALVDLARIAELRGIDKKGNALVIGAMTTHDEVANSPVVRSAIAGLCDVAGSIGDPHVRNRGTIGGSVANNDPAADYPAAVLGLAATVITDRRQIAADDYFQGMFTTALEPGEIIVRLSFPIPKKAAYEKFAHPASGYAMTGVFVAETAKGVRVAVTGAGPGVFRWKDAEVALAKKLAVESVAKLKLAPDDLNQDIHGSREYRANLVSVLTKRAVAQLTGR